jgi:4-hydroxy-tetrahydrodipicolinate reductase
LILTSREAGLSADELASRLRGADCAIDFSLAEAVLRNVRACALAGVPLVEGTTGWKSQEAEVRQLIDEHMTEHKAAMIYGANFSLGVNLFYRLVAYAGKMFAHFSDYDAFLEEAHHARKRDAPSGTALRLREMLVAQLGRDVPVASTRAGFIPGTHRVGFDSAADQITLTHTARSREGFASGALLAADWIVGRTGFYEFTQIVDEILLSREGEAES